MKTLLLTYILISSNSLIFSQEKVYKCDYSKPFTTIMSIASGDGVQSDIWGVNNSNIKSIPNIDFNAIDFTEINMSLLEFTKSVKYKYLAFKRKNKSKIFIFG